jgi:hypothetical protein
MRQSYVWDTNSCFIDAAMEAYFRAFISMGGPVRGEFLRRIRSETPNTGLRDVVEHFWLRGLLSGAITADSAKGATKPSQTKLVHALLASQLNVKRLISTKWGGGKDGEGMPGCSRTWLNQMINVSSTKMLWLTMGIDHFSDRYHQQRAGIFRDIAFHQVCLRLGARDSTFQNSDSERNWNEFQRLSTGSTIYFSGLRVPVA